MTENEGYHWGGVIEAVRVVPHARLAHHLNGAAEGSVALLYKVRVLGHGHDVVRIAHDVDDRHARAR